MPFKSGTYTETAHCTENPRHRHPFTGFLPRRIPGHKGEKNGGSKQTEDWKKRRSEQMKEYYRRKTMNKGCKLTCVTQSVVKKKNMQ